MFLGEVQNPGIYFSYEGSINILDAISMANGITNYADLNKVVLKRPYGERIVTHKINLTDNSIFSSEYFYLQPNDLIYIPPSKLKRNRENTSTYSLLLGTLSILMIAINLMINN
ncbi:hypothetical protein [uncultured Draconibacterium sp.]|uniref:polysaccharide biosynthesis/export family protein n=1 Tax=uncultured Draconibacterium sp. TaxID=1573823 RepID=UPI0029C65378|nr:hypothetical protein [uncultured Draconibacterium sp.]